MPAEEKSPNPLKIGITGGIGSGKSTICKIFSQFGIPIYDADTRAKKLMVEDQDLVRQIKAAFGKEAYTEDGSLNRSYLAEKIFNDEKLLKMLNGLVHPKTEVDFLNWVKNQKEAPYVVKEAALMYESGTDQSCDKMITVVSPEALRIERILQRDPHRTEEGIRKIMARQMPEEEKIKRSDFVIYNDEKTHLIPQVQELHNKFLNLHR